MNRLADRLCKHSLQIEIRKWKKSAYVKYEIYFTILMYCVKLYTTVEITFLWNQFNFLLIFLAEGHIHHLTCL